MHWKIIFILFNVGCSQSDKQLHPVSPTPTPVATSISLSRGEIFPLALLEIKKGAEIVHCMAGFFGGDRLITAGHCLSNLPTNACQAGLVQITWAAKKLGCPQTLGTKIGCSRFEGPTNLNAQNDLATLDMLMGELRPLDQLHFATSAPAANASIFLWGPPGKKNSFLIGFGIILGLGNLLTHNASSTPGFSGSPIFLWPEGFSDSATVVDVIPKALELGVIGIHTGFSGGVSIAIPAEIARSRVTATNGN